jgi:hypothetical protein
MRVTDCLAQQTPGAITYNGAAKLFAGHEPIPVMRQTVGRYAQNEKRMPPHTPGCPQPVKIFFAVETQMTLHGSEHDPTANSSS